MAKIEVLAEIELDDAIIEIRLKPKQNRMNLTRACLHLKSLAYGENIEKHGRCRYNIYHEDEARWLEAKKRTLNHFGVKHVEDIPIDLIEEANDYCIRIIDLLCLNDC